MAIALITGASQGLGEEFATIFARNGYDLVLVARNKEKLSQLSQKLIKDCSIAVTVVVQDLSAPNAAANIYRILRQKKILIDILVNNAGFATYGLFVETDSEKEEEEITVNVLTLTILTKRIAQDMVKRKSGKILNIASTAAFFPGPLMAVYYATKAYVLSFSLALSNELKDFGITVTCLCPGPTNTGFVKRAHMQKSKLFAQHVMSAHEVAIAGYNGMLEGKPVVVPGKRNEIIAFVSRIIPKSLAAAVVRQSQEHTNK